MKVGILAGGFGTRLAEETEIRPKPMIEVGGMPILWHIMKHYAARAVDSHQLIGGQCEICCLPQAKVADALRHFIDPDEHSLL